MSNDPLDFTALLLAGAGAGLPWTPQQLNPYSYALNNPQAARDPLGLRSANAVLSTQWPTAAEIRQAYRSQMAQTLYVLPVPGVDFYVLSLASASEAAAVATGTVAGTTATTTAAAVVSEDAVIETLTTAEAVDAYVAKQYAEILARSQARLFRSGYWKYFI